MKKIILLSTFFFSISTHALPDCPSDTSVAWNNCFGTYILDNGHKYVGEFKDGKYHGQGTYTFTYGDKYVGKHKNNYRHGQGTYTFANGRKRVGYFMNGDFIPNICEGMGLAKGTESFGNCVNKLIDDL